MAETHTLMGSAAAPNFSRSMTTDVSSSPTSSRSDTGGDVLAHALVQIITKSSPLNGWSSREDLVDSLRIDEAFTTQGPQFTHRFRVASHDKGTAFFEASHDAPAVIPQFPLADLLGHPSSVALRATTLPVGGCSPEEILVG